MARGEVIFMFARRLGDYGVAVGSVLLALLLQLPLGPLELHAPFIFLLAAVVATAFYAGLRPALAAILLAVVLANMFLLGPAQDWAMAGAKALVSALFVGVSMWIAWLVTTRRTADEALRSDEERLRLILSQVPGKVWTTDRDLRITSMQGGSTLSGWDPASAVGTTLYERAAGRGDAYRPLAAHQQALAGTSAEYEHNPGGKDRTIAARVEPLRDAEGNVVGTIGVGLDITDRMRLEETLRRYELLAAHSRDIILFMDREDGRILEANTAAAEAYGYTRGELLGLTIRDLRAPETLNLTDELMAEADVHGILFETAHRRRDGQIFPVEVSARGATISGRRTLISVVRDITERKRTEEALQRAHDLLEGIMGSTQDLIAAQDTDFRYISFNEAYRSEIRRLFGADIEIGTRLLDALAHLPEEQEKAVALWKRALSGEEFTATEDLGDPDRARRTFQMRFSALRNADGELIGAAHIVRDVTDQRRAEEALRQSEQRFRGIFDSAGVGIVEVDTDDRFIAVNDRVCEILGYTQEELLRLNVHELTAPEDRAISDRLNAELHEGTRDRIDYEKRYLKRDGTPLWVHVTVSPVRDADGRWVRSIATVEDISERKAATEKLQRSETELRTIVENLSEGLVVSDLDGNLLHWNRAALDTHGFENLEEARRRLADFTDVFELSTLEGAVIPMDQWPIPRILRGERLHDWEVRVRRLDKDWKRVYSYGGTLIHDPKGQPLLAVITIVDITERKRGEEALKSATVSAERAKAAAEEANSAKDNFLAVLSHELRTPLTPVLAAVSMLQKDARLEPEVHGMLEMVRRNVELEARLIDDLLDLTRIARGKVELDRRPAELGTVIQRAVEVCLPDIKARNLHFGVDMMDGPYPVEADAARLQQVFWNLLKNAVKFTPVGGCVGVRCRRDRDGQVVVEVSDSGEGIAPEFLSRLFNAFEQGEAGTTKQFGGLGLGLAISRSLVEMHHGTIEARSGGKGKGATFTVRLPLLEGSKVRGLHTATAPGAPPASEPAARSLHVLYVEDHGDTAELMASLLEFEGHRVQTAGDVATALDLASRNTFDVLVSDLGLPDGSGIDLMRQLRARGQSLPGIALSGYGQDRDIQQSRNAGFSVHVVKPVSIEHLLDVLAQVSSSAS